MSVRSVPVQTQLRYKFLCGLNTETLRKVHWIFYNVKGSGQTKAKLVDAIMHICHTTEQWSTFLQQTHVVTTLQLHTFFRDFGYATDQQVRDRWFYIHCFEVQPPHLSYSTHSYAGVSPLGIEASGSHVGRREGTPMALEYVPSTQPMRSRGCDATYDADEPCENQLMATPHSSMFSPGESTNTVEVSFRRVAERLARLRRSDEALCMKLYHAWSDWYRSYNWPSSRYIRWHVPNPQSLQVMHSVFTDVNGFVVQLDPPMFFLTVTTPLADISRDVWSAQLHKWFQGMHV